MTAAESWTELIEGVQWVQAAADRDSSDEHFEALIHTLDRALEMLGLDWSEALRGSPLSSARAAMVNTIELELPGDTEVFRSDSGHVLIATSGDTIISISADGATRETSVNYAPEWAPWL